MPARTRAPRLPKVPDIQERLRANIEARAQAERWARKGTELVEAGRIAKAKKGARARAALSVEDDGARGEVALWAPKSEGSGETDTTGDQSVLSPPTRSLSVWERLKEHKIAHWTLAYAAAGYALLHGTEMVSNALEWPHLIVRILTLVLLLGVPVVATVAWYHGHRAQHRVSGAELTIITVLLVIAGSVLWHFARIPQEHTLREVGATAQTMTAAAPSPPNVIPEKSIAVLPFLDLSEKKDQEYFADGMAEEILNLLAKIPELKVIGRTSSFSFRGKTDDLREIGTTLGTAYVVEGSVRRSGDQVRVTAQLIDTRNGADRWSQTYDRVANDVFRVQGEIATSLVRALQLEVAPVALAIARSSPRSAEAHDIYLRGLACLRAF